MLKMGRLGTGVALGLMLIITAWSRAQAATEASPDNLELESIDVSNDAVAQYALEYLREWNVVLDREPLILFSSEVTDDFLIETGHRNSGFEEGCPVRLHLVVLHGNFDIEPIVGPILAATRSPIHAHFLGLIYEIREDLAVPSLSGTFADLDGATFKATLGNEQLPDLPADHLPVSEADIFVEPCEPTLVPGGPAVDTTPAVGPWSPTAVPSTTPTGG